MTAFVDDRPTFMPEETPDELERLRQQLLAIEEGRVKFIPHEQVMQILVGLTINLNYFTSSYRTTVRPGRCHPLAGRVRYRG